jgi:hypothetical protein
MLNEGIRKAGGTLEFCLLEGNSLGLFPNSYLFYLQPFFPDQFINNINLYSLLSP